MASTGDQYVLNVQKWLNKRYGSDGRFKTLTEDGYIGWGTINGLIRALQIELGIQQTADNFGKGTEDAFNAKYARTGAAIVQQADGDNTEDAVYGIIQGALLCKGYSTGVASPTLHFYNGTGNAIKKLKKDAGLSDTTSDVTLHVMKALLSMDYFVTYKTDQHSKNIRAIQQYLNGNYEDYIGIKPCDGVYQASTSRALMYALQAEEKMPTTVANGNFGPATKSACPVIPYSGNEKSYKGTVYTNEEISKFICLARIVLYVNGFEEEGGFNINGTYTTSLETIIKDFQRLYAIEETGIINLTTWASLLISCGDTSRSALACDCATILTDAKAKTLYNAGYRYVGRYLSGTIGNGISKALSIEELQIAFKNGLRIFPIQQGSANKVSYFTEEQAVKDVQNACRYAVRLGIPFGTTIYFAVDCDPVDTQITNYIIPYFKKISEYMKNVKKSIYKIGIYGARNVCSRVSTQGYATTSFVLDMSTGYSGNLGFSLPKNWAFDQFATVKVGSGEGLIEIDKDGFSGLDEGFGEIFPSDIRNVYSTLEEVFEICMEKVNYDIEMSNKLLLHYLRRAEKYTTTTWEMMAGPVDSNINEEIDRKLVYAFEDAVTFVFDDPLKQVQYDLPHFAATLDALLTAVTSDFVGLDDIVDDYAGWGGDILTFSDEVYKKIDDLEWANENICQNDETSFGPNDYIADADAIQFSNFMLQNKELTFPEIFITYFNTKTYISKRTTELVNYYGGYIEFYNRAGEILLSDTLVRNTLRNMIIKNDKNQKVMQTTLDAFANFIELELKEENYNYNENEY